MGGIPKEDLIDYKYIGHALMYDPIIPMDNAFEQTKLALPGNRGVFTHPSLRKSDTASGGGGGGGRTIVPEDPALHYMIKQDRSSLNSEGRFKWNQRYAASASGARHRLRIPLPTEYSEPAPFMTLHNKSVPDLKF